MKTFSKQDNTNSYEFLNVKYEQLELDYQADSQSLWFYMKSKPRPCFTPILLNEIQDMITRMMSIPYEENPVQYLVAASGVPGVYNLGGDLKRFCEYIAKGDRESLRAYAYAGIEMGYASCRHFDRGITSISLVQGSALGGGFETALSCNVVVAEESAQLGFPEILFNLFPGMGAFTYLSRKVHPRVAEKIISSGKTYTGTELYEMGIIDVLAEDGAGEEAVKNYIKQHSHHCAGRQAMQQAYLQVNPVSIKEMRVIADIWVETALQLDERSLRVMERLIRAQSKKMIKQEISNQVA